MASFPSIPNDFLESQIGVIEQEPRFEGYTLNSISDVQPIPVVYGYRRVTPPRIFARTKSNDSKVLCCAYVLSEGPITKIDKIFIGDKQLPLKSVTPNVVHSLNEIAFSYEIFTGTPSDGISQLMKQATGQVGPLVPFQESLRNIAYLVCSFTYVKDQNGLANYDQIPTIQVDVCGRKLRNASSIGAEQNIIKDANPADVLLDYLTNDIYGRGLDISLIDTTSLSLLRSSFNSEIRSYSGGQNMKRLSFNGLIDTSVSVLDNIKQICSEFGIILTYANGKYRFNYEYRSPTIQGTITEADIIDNYQVTVPQLNSRYNNAAITYYDRDYRFQSFSQTYDNETFLSNDDGKELPANVTLRYITDAYQARNNAEQIVKKSRNSDTYRFLMVPRALQWTVGDCVNFESINDVPGPSSTVVLRITDITINDDLTVNIEAVRHFDANYPPFTLGPRQTYYTQPEGAPDTTITVPSPPPEPPQVIRPEDNIRTFTFPNANYRTYQLTGGISSIYPFYTYGVSNTKLNQDASDNNFYFGSTTIQSMQSTQQEPSRVGIDYELVIQTSGSYLYAWIKFGLYLTSRVRNTSFTYEGKPAEGMLNIGGEAFPNIFFSYEISNNGTTLGNNFGWASESGYSYEEQIIFNPALNILPTAIQKSNPSARPQNNLPLNSILIPNPQLPVHSAPPRLTYDFTFGYYKLSPVVSPGITPEQSTLRRQIFIDNTMKKNIGSRYNTIPRDVQDFYDVRRTLKLRFWVPTLGGSWHYLGERQIDISTLTLGFSRARTNYQNWSNFLRKKGFGLPPFNQF